MISVPAVYENGVLRLTQPLDLPDGETVQAVSYTHLTLPTICSV